MNNQTIPIVFASDNNFVPYMAATMQSIMENAGKSREYIFYILHHGIKNDFMEMLKNQVEYFASFAIEFIDVSNYIAKYEGLFVSRHITIEAYFRLLIPELLINYDKVIYLDGDMICCTDISALFDTDLGDKLLAAVRSGRNFKIKQLNEKQHISFELKKQNDYFNSGLLVLNLNCFRKITSSDELFKLASSRKWDFHDQDVLNVFAEGKTFFLPYYWNFISLTKEKKHFPDSFLKEYDEAEENPGIVHYVGTEKPWECEFLCPYFELFWKYSTRTSFIGVIIKYMKSKNLIIDLDESFKKRIIARISQRRGLGLRFILDCVKAWLLR